MLATAHAGAAARVFTAALAVRLGSMPTPATEATKIGCIYAVTGNAASAGQSAKAAVDLAAQIVDGHILSSSKPSRLMMGRNGVRFDDDGLEVRVVLDAKDAGSSGRDTTPRPQWLPRQPRRPPAMTISDGQASAVSQ
jgi:hypothetical protein